MTQQIEKAFGNRSVAQTAVAWMQRNYMLPDEKFKAAHGAWRSSLQADRPDNRDERIQGLHREKLLRFLVVCGGME